MVQQIIKKVIFFGLGIALLFIGSVCLSASQGQTVVYEHETCILFCAGSGHVTLGASNRTTLKTPSGADVEYHVDSDGLAFLSVNQINQAKTVAPLPTPPQVIRVGFGKNWFIGDYTEIANSDVLVGSLHVLQGLNPKFLTDALESNPRFANQPYRLVEPSFRGSPLDLIFIVVGTNNDSTAIARVNELVQGRIFAPDLTPREHYFSYQLSDQNRMSFSQSSVGLIGRVSVDGTQALISTGGENYTAPGSSGSVVFVRRKNNNQWSIGGIVECGIPGSRRRFAAIRLITSLAIRQSNLQIVSNNKLSHESERIDSGCIPLDGKAGGG